jgi:hypothetical protein
MTFCIHTILELGKIVNVKLCMFLYTIQNNTNLHKQNKQIMFLDVAAAGCLQSCDVGPVGDLDDVANWPKFRPQIEKWPLKKVRAAKQI